MSIHGRWECSCGELIAQCRCMEADKQVRVIKDGCDKCRRRKAEAGRGAQVVRDFRAVQRGIPVWLDELGFETKGNEDKEEAAR